MKTGTTSSWLAGWAAGMVLTAAPVGAFAQAQPPSAAPQAAPIVNGHRVAPRPPSVPQDATEDDAAKLLERTPEPGPPVQPHDLYGNPLGRPAPSAKPEPKPAPATGK